MATVKLLNLQRRMRSFNLEHPTFVNQNAEHPVGKPESLTLLPRETKTVDEDVLLCREIKSALTPRGRRRPTLRVVS